MMTFCELMADYFGFTENDWAITFFEKEFEMDITHDYIDLALNQMDIDRADLSELRNYFVGALFEEAVGYMLYIVDEYDLSDKIFADDFECRIVEKNTQFLLNGFEFETKNELKDILQWYKDNYKTIEDTEENI